jgi:glycosyltransferase involved in cell wall biosynthesis
MKSGLGFPHDELDSEPDMTSTRVCLIPKLIGLGGMVSFQGKLVEGLTARGIDVSFSLDDRPYQAVLVIGGIRDLAGLWRARRQGLPVVQRLDGMNWLHRKRYTGVKHYIRAEYGNWLLSLIRAQLATKIVYQSSFSKQWWEQTHGPTHVPCDVIYNGVDLNRYRPESASQPAADPARVLMVEGTLGGGYELGLETGIRLVQRLNQPTPSFNKKVELVVAGKASPALQEKWVNRAGITLVFTGQVPAETIIELDRSAHLLYSADINAACPNSVIEALACGLPVAAFNTGALPELVTGESGRIVPYGGDPWNLDVPDVDAMAEAAREILRKQEQFRPAARRRAEQAFSLDQMVAGYVDALLGAS